MEEFAVAIGGRGDIKEFWLGINMENMHMIHIDDFGIVMNADKP